MSNVADATPGGFFAPGVIYHSSTLGLDTNRHMPEYWCTGSDIHPQTGQPIAWGFYRNHPNDDWTPMPVGYDEWASGRWAGPGDIPPIDRHRPVSVYALAGAPAPAPAAADTVHVITNVAARTVA